jgi:hypothetical protein
MCRACADVLHTTLAAGNSGRRATLPGSIFDVGLDSEPTRKKARTGAPLRLDQRVQQAELHEWVQTLLVPLADYDKGIRNLRHQARIPM